MNSLIWHRANPKAAQPSYAQLTLLAAEGSDVANRRRSEDEQPALLPRTGHRS